MSIPGRMPRGQAIEDAAVAMMRADLAKSRRRNTRRVRPLSFAVPVAAMMVAAIVLVLTFSPIHIAAALGPVPLNFTDTGQTPADVLAQVRQHMADHPSRSEPRRGSTSVGWYLHQDHTADGTRELISPEITTFRWEPDQSGQVTITAGHAYWADGSEDDIPTDDVARPGTVLSDMTFPAGTFGAPDADPPGSTREQLSEYLAAIGLPDDADAADLIDLIPPAFSYWTMSDAQHAALLETLLTRDDITVLGTTSDRADRPVIGIAADSHRFPGVRKIVLVSTTTGRILGVESIRTRTTTTIPAGTVIGYTLWETTPQ